MSARQRSVVWSSEAAADLDTIWEYYAQAAGRTTADTLVREIGAAVALIETHPFAGRSRNELRPGLRSIASSPHVVFYRVGNDTLEIVRVLDGRRDIDEIFADGDPNTG